VTLAKVIVVVLTIIMGVTLVYAFTQGDLSADGAVLLSIPWGIVSLVDVYVGFSLFSGWVVFREPSRLRAVLWVILIMVLGFLVACLYTLFALQASKGDWRRFWLGHRAEDTQREQ
jgi:hypothetical protein